MENEWILVVMCWSGWHNLINLLAKHSADWKNVEFFFVMNFEKTKNKLVSLDVAIVP